MVIENSGGCDIRQIPAKVLYSFTFVLPTVSTIVLKNSETCFAVSDAVAHYRIS